MSLKNMETGQTATPLAMLQEMNEQDRQHIKTDLLKEALAISNEKCNKLIEMQNKLIEEMRADMAATEYSLTTTVDKAVREIKMETAKTEKLNVSIGIQVKKAVSTSVNDMKAEMLINVRETLSKTQEEIRKTEKKWNSYGRISVLRADFANSCCGLHLHCLSYRRSYLQFHCFEHN